MLIGAITELDIHYPVLVFYLVDYFSVTIEKKMKRAKSLLALISKVKKNIVIDFMETAPFSLTQEQVSKAINNLFWESVFMMYPFLFLDPQMPLHGSNHCSQHYLLRINISFSVAARTFPALERIVVKLFMVILCFCVQTWCVEDPCPALPSEHEQCS